MSAAPVSSPTADPLATPGWVRFVGQWGLPLAFLLFALDAGLRASLKPLWFDELITYYIADLPSIGSIWEALRQTADGQPPMTHLVMRASHAVFGNGELGTRLPYLGGFAGMCWFLFLCVRRRVGALPALAATAFTCVTWAYEYAYEARPYALLMFFCAASFYFWSAAAAGERRGIAIPLFGLSLAAMMSTHYYAGLLLIPFGVGELTRAVSNKRLDWRLSGILATAPFVLLLFLPLLVGVRDEYTKAFWSPVEVFDTYGAYVVLLAPAILPVIAAMVAAGITSRWDAKDTPAKPAGWIGGFPRHEALAALALAAIPLVYVGAAALLTGAYAYRYSLPSVFGVAIVFVMVMHDWLGQRPQAHAALYLTLLAGFVLTRLAPTLSGNRDYQTVEELHQELAAVEEAMPGDDPIVVAGPLNFLPYYLYTPKAIQDRLVYPTDIPAARDLGESDSAEVSIIKLARWAGYQAPSYAQQWRQRHGYYVLVHKGSRFMWFPAKLQEDQVRMRLLAEGDAYAVYRCCDEAQTAMR